MARREFLGSVVETTTTSSLSSTDTSISLTDGSTFPAGSTSPFVIVLDRGTASEEKVLITSRSSNTLTVSQRGYDGTTATTHSSGAKVDHVLDATSIQDMNTSINDVTDVVTADTANNRVGINKTNPTASLDVVGNIAVSGTVDGRDVATDGTKLDGIESGAVADHGNLAGLTDDDHTQYLLADGTRTATALTVSGNLTVDTDTLHVDAINDGVGIGKNNPSFPLDVVGTTASDRAYLRNTATASTTSTDHALTIGGQSNLRFDGSSIMAMSTGTMGDLHLQKDGGRLRIGNNYDADVYLNGVLQGHWTSYTPSLYTGPYGSNSTHTLGSNGSINARYCVWGNIVFVQIEASYGDFTAGNSTYQPRYSAPPNLRVVPRSGVNSSEGDLAGVGLISGYMSHDYIGAMVAFNSGSHSSNGFLQFAQGNVNGNYLAYDAVYDNQYYYNNNVVTAYGRVHMVGWYGTDAL